MMMMIWDLKWCNNVSNLEYNINESNLIVKSKKKKRLNVLCLIWMNVYMLYVK